MLIERRNKRGQAFYGCSKFPACRYTSRNLPTLASTEAKVPPSEEAGTSADTAGPPIAAAGTPIAIDNAPTTTETTPEKNNESNTPAQSPSN
jgi:ssDNA-binding Zn-finger/Zn-ribbon topoisomerase 1